MSAWSLRRLRLCNWIAWLTQRGHGRCGVATRGLNRGRRHAPGAAGWRKTVHERVVTHGHALELVGIAVVGPGSRGSPRRGPWRWRSAPRKCPAPPWRWWPPDVGQPPEGRHDAPHRAQQPHVGTDGADIGEELQALPRRSISRGGHAHRALGSSSMVRGSRPRRWRRRANSRKPPKMLSMPLMSLPRPLTRGTGRARSAPDQKRSSNSLAPPMARSSMALRKMITHDRKGEQQQDAHHQLDEQAGAEDQGQDVEFTAHDVLVSARSPSEWRAGAALWR